MLFPLFVHFRCLICNVLSLFGQFFAIELAALAEGQIEERFEWQMDKRKILKFGWVRLEILAFGLVISAPG